MPSDNERALQALNAVDYAQHRLAVIAIPQLADQHPKDLETAQQLLSRISDLCQYLDLPRNGDGQPAATTETYIQIAIRVRQPNPSPEPHPSLPPPSPESNPTPLPQPENHNCPITFSQWCADHGIAESTIASKRTLVNRYGREGKLTRTEGPDGQYFFNSSDLDGIADRLNWLNPAAPEPQPVPPTSPQEITIASFLQSIDIAEAELPSAKTRLEHVLKEMRIPSIASEPGLDDLFSLDDLRQQAERIKLVEPEPSHQSITDYMKERIIPPHLQTKFRNRASQLARQAEARGEQPRLPPPEGQKSHLYPTDFLDQVAHEITNTTTVKKN